MARRFYSLAAALVGIVAAAAIPQTCIHDDIHASFPVLISGATHVQSSPQIYVVEHAPTRALQQQAYSPIRITLDTSLLVVNAEPQYACYAAGQAYQPTLGTDCSARSTCGPSDVLSDAQREYVTGTILPAALQFFTDTLSVVPVVGRLALNHPIPESSCVSPAEGICNEFICCDGNFPPADKANGIPNSDFHVYVTARPTSGNIIAWALTCQADQYGRPTAGQINFGPGLLSTDATQLAQQLSTAIHELTHALGFSASAFSTWRSPGSNVVWSGTLNGVAVNALITPNIATAASAQFGCLSGSWTPMPAGGLLEDYGGSGTVGSHWKKRVFMNEYMTGTADPNSVYSSMTLAAFADMGWYQVSYARAQRLPWGNGQGCSFVLGTCEYWPSSYFCSVPNQGGCTVDMRYRAACNAFEAPYTLPSQYQYFSGNPTLGGQSGYLDYCPVYWRLSDGDCFDPTTLGLWFYGEQPGPNALCFGGTYQRNALASTPAPHGGCLQSSCNIAETLVVTLSQTSGSLIVTCPIAGGDVLLDTLPGSQYTGTLTCPPSNVVCTGSPCDRNACSGQGTCNPGDGTCKCHAGYFGATPYDCLNKYCPLGVGATGNATQCAGHATCNQVTGQCLDESGLPGCFAGWADGPDGACSRRGCPSHASTACNNNTGGSCECAGYGSCNGTTGTCVCLPGHIGYDCGLSDCPGSPSCGGGFTGDCDIARGVCACTAAGLLSTYVGPACEALYIGAGGPSTQLHYIGETDSTTNSTGAPYLGILRAKQYTYFSFAVSSAQFPIDLVVSIVSAAALNTSLPPTLLPNTTYNASTYFSPGALLPYYSDAGSGPLVDMPGSPLVVASYATYGVPTATSLQFSSIPMDASGLVLGIHFSPGVESSFSQSGTMLVAALVFMDAYVEVNLTRDGCVSLNCSNGGVCIDGHCQCPRFAEESDPSRTFGWSGQTCAVPDCPGFPSCLGRGSCDIAVPGDPTHVTGRPFCECASVYTGEMCQEYNVSAVVLGVTVVGGIPIPDTSNFHELPVATGTTVGLWNQSFDGTVDAGQNDNAILVDPSALGTCCGMNGSFAVFLRLTDVTISRLADPVLLVGANAPPSLAVYAAADLGSWQSRAGTHELAFLTRGVDLQFVTVVNGRYAQDRLAYSLYVEVVAGGACPPSMSNCSGHGTCSLATCMCDLGWEGLLCAVPAVALANASTAPAMNLAPGQWKYWVFSIPPFTAEVGITLNPTSSGGLPLLSAFFDSGRHANSLAGLRSETAMLDFEAYSMQSRIGSTVTQRVTALRSDPRSQSVLYIGASNSVQAKAVASVIVAVVALTEQSTRCSGPADDCRVTQCSGHGDVVSVSGQLTCVCDVGWNPANRCAGPRFPQFNSLVAAAQSISFLCSICGVDSLLLGRSALALYKVPQPLQSSTGLGISVAPSASVPTARRLANSRLPLRATQFDNSSVNPYIGMLGVPALLVATTFPRSIVDFIYIDASNLANDSISISNGSSTGVYVIAVYALTPGDFAVQASRVAFSINGPSMPSFFDQLWAWIVNSTLGIVTVVFGGLLLLAVSVVCCWQFLLPSSGAALRAQEILELRHTRLVRSVRSIVTATATSDTALSQQQELLSSALPLPNGLPPSSFSAASSCRRQLVVQKCRDSLREQPTISTVNPTMGLQHQFQASALVSPVPDAPSRLLHLRAVEGLTGVQVAPIPPAGGRDIELVGWPVRATSLGSHQEWL